MDLLIRYALSFVGLPYIWGGDDPVVGFDCSGLVQEILASVGMDPKGDQDAHTLYKWFLSQPKTRKQMEAGSLCFYGKPERVTHIAFVIDRFRVVEAGGGGSRTLNAKDASAQNAFVRIRPFDHRADLVGVLLPDYSAVL